ncbi:hypothetical protein KM043_016468 [Ampulex compressa]|nr:hypothetical protein KM043_016468 [Ampulex compressa]
MSHDGLSEPKSLRIKISDDSDPHEDVTSNTMFARRRTKKRWNGKGEKLKRESLLFKFHHCWKVGHKATDCKERLIWKTIGLVAEFSGRSKGVIVQDTLHVTKLQTNFLSVAKSTDKDYMVIFGSNLAKIVGDRGKAALMCDQKCGLNFLCECERDANAHMVEVAMRKS